ncbi:flavodoxin [Dysgonomonas massiliensis]|uniref:flavodoxin n=1 Tax=Dysgonomonas massiliensis TaxID=2040292 RepID=UPI000C78CE1F|nr:flavodoxin [Dysgonomonas massiliensis]
MANIAIFYGSTSGSTQDVAEDIAKAFDIDKSHLFDVSKAKTDFSAYDLIIFGSSTYGMGDLQDDWESYIDDLKGADLNGKKVAIFGLGDSSSYSDTFCDAMGKIYEVVKDKGANVIGFTSTDGYSFDESEAVVDGQFVGLAIDNDNEPDETPARIASWVEILKSNI